MREDRLDDATLDEVRRLHEAASNNFDTYTVVTTRSLGAVLAEVRAARATETAARALLAETDTIEANGSCLTCGYTNGAHLAGCPWDALRAALSAASTEPDHAPFPPEHLDFYYPPDRVLDEAVTVESNERWYAASGQSYLAERVLDVPPGSTVQIVLSGSAASATDEPERCVVTENGSVLHRWACDFGPDCPAPGGVQTGGPAGAGRAPDDDGPAAAPGPEGSDHGG